MANWKPISQRDQVRPRQRVASNNATTIDAAFAEWQDCELRVDKGVDKASIESDRNADMAARASDLIATIQSQLASLEAQRERLTTMLGSLPQLPR